MTAKGRWRSFLSRPKVGFVFYDLGGYADKALLRTIMSLLKQMTFLLELVICIFIRNIGDYGKNNGSFGFR